MNNGKASGLRTYLMRGVLFSLPIIVTCLVVSFIYSEAETWLGGITALLAQWLLPKSWIAPFPDGHIPGASLFLLLVVLVLLGLIASWKCGRHGLRLIDQVFSRIPLIRSIYTGARKVVEAVGDPKQSKFQRVVYLDWPGPGTRVLGFVTAETINQADGEKYLAVFVPHIPNPTSGFVAWVPESSTTDAGITPQEGFSLCMSLGLLAPPSMPIKPAK